MPCEGFLVGGFVPAFWWMHLDLVLPDVSPVPCSEFWGVYRFGMALGSLPADVQCCVPILLQDQCEASRTSDCWLLGGTWSQCTYGGLWMSSHLLMFHGAGGSLMVQILKLSLLSRGFRLNLLQ